MRTLVLLASIFLLCGCKVTRQVAIDEQKEWESVSTENLSAGSHISTHIDLVAKDSIWWRNVGKVTIFDTSVTDADGTHPVKAIIETESEGVKKKDREEITCEDRIDTLSIQEATYEKTKSHYNEKTNTKANIGYATNWLLIMAVFALIIIAFRKWQK